MIRLAHRIFLVLILAVLSTGFVGAQTTDNNTPLTNAAVLKLVRAGFKEKTVISIIDARPPAFDLSPERMIELKRSGVSENIILAMLNRQQGLMAGDEAWENDPFFQDKRDKQKGNSTSGTAQNQRDIFGSSGSGQSSTRTRGGGGTDAAGDTVTTGTATVRIIRPPTEPGNGPLKLEKTPSLTNDSIIELVEAGFSEGTIVRRIEQSPVDFDLSAPQIADLRKHRVGDKILAAMKAAMGDDSGPGKTRPLSNGSSKPQ
ncbi:MAG TPA: hypothetical protein VLN44_06500 [Pyrinomonadaceae bacterium]|nr:hypothetical protein [Pyrinomonadaceae bacterium]